MMLAWIGCAEQVTLLEGTVFESHDPLSGGLGGAELRFLDEYGEALGHTTAADDGSFAVQLPSGESLFAVVSADGYATSVFPGAIGIETEAAVADHAIYGVSDAELDGWLAAWAGCPGTDGDGAVVLGEVREFGVVDPYTGESPTTNAASIEVRQTGDRSWAGCYLDEDGVAWDPEALTTGKAGVFGVFGVEAGLSDLVIRTTVTPTAVQTDVYPVLVPDEADARVVSPWFPAWATFPM